MADRIYVTYSPTTAPGAYHTTIHYERTGPTGDVVEHVIIEAEPENLEKLSASDKAIGVVDEASRRDDGPSLFGRIDAHAREQKASHDPNAPYEIIAEGDDLSANLARMQLFAHAVNVAGFAYRGDRQNSNTFASGALRAGNLPPATGVAHDPAGLPGELLEFFAPGLNEPLRAPIGPRREAGEVARRSFDRRFGEWASSPAGPAKPSAAGDPDSFNDRFGNWGAVPTAGAGDTRSPVLRALEEYRTSAAPDGRVPTSAQGAPPPIPGFQPVGVDGVLGKFMGDHLTTPAVAPSSSLPALPGSTAPSVASEESAFDSRSGNALGGPRPATHPRLRRVSSAFPGFTSPDSDPRPLERDRLLGIFGGKPMSLSPFALPFGGLTEGSDASGNGALFDFLDRIASGTPASRPPDDDPRGLGRDGQVQPWILRRQR